MEERRRDLRIEIDRGGGGGAGSARRFLGSLRPPHRDELTCDIDLCVRI